MPNSRGESPLIAGIKTNNLKAIQFAYDWNTIHTQSQEKEGLEPQFLFDFNFQNFQNSNCILHYIAKVPSLNMFTLAYSDKNCDQLCLNGNLQLPSQLIKKVFLSSRKVTGRYQRRGFIFQWAHQKKESRTHHMDKQRKSQYSRSFQKHSYRGSERAGDSRRVNNMFRTSESRELSQEGSFVKRVPFSGTINTPRSKSRLKDKLAETRKLQNLGVQRAEQQKLRQNKKQVIVSLKGVISKICFEFIIKFDEFLNHYSKLLEVSNSQKKMNYKNNDHQHIVSIDRQSLKSKNICEKFESYLSKKIHNLKMSINAYKVLNEEQISHLTNNQTRGADGRIQKGESDQQNKIISLENLVNLLFRKSEFFTTNSSLQYAMYKELIELIEIMRSSHLSRPLCAKVRQGVRSSLKNKLLLYEKQKYVKNDLVVRAKLQLKSILLDMIQNDNEHRLEKVGIRESRRITTQDIDKSHILRSKTTQNNNRKYSVHRDLSQDIDESSKISITRRVQPKREFFLRSRTSRLQNSNNTQDKRTSKVVGQKSHSQTRAGLWNFKFFN